MIMQRQSDGIYTQIGFIKTPTEDIDKIVDRNGDIYFTKGFTIKATGYPVTLPNSLGKSLLDYKIYGNIVQNSGTVTENKKLKDSSNKVIVDSEGNEIRTSEVVTYNSPSPDAPAEVKGYGDRTRNLVFVPDISATQRNNNYINFNFSEDIINNLCDIINNYIGTKLSFDYTLSDSRFYKQIVLKYEDSEDKLTNLSGILIKKEITNIIIRAISNDANLNGTTVSMSNFQLELGTEATPYVPYGYEIPVVSRGKNLFDKNGEKTQGFIDKTGTIQPNNIVWYTFNDKIKCSGVVTVSALNGLGTGTFIKCYDNSENFLGAVEQGNNNNDKRTISLLPNTAYIQTCCRNNNFDSYQIELGSTATEYEPYREPITTPIYLPEPLYKDDYVVKDKSGGRVHRAWGVKVFDGTEEWQEYSRSQIFGVFITIPSMKSNSRRNGYCNHYKTQNTPANAKNDGITFGADNNNIYITTSNVNNLSGFKAFLASKYAKGTPVTVYYPLAEPTEESIDLPDIPTFDGTTIIETDTEIPSSNIEVSYKSKKPQ